MSEALKWVGDVRAQLMHLDLTRVNEWIDATHNAVGEGEWGAGRLPDDLKALVFEISRRQRELLGILNRRLEEDEVDVGHDQIREEFADEDAEIAMMQEFLQFAIRKEFGLQLCKHVGIRKGGIVVTWNGSVGAPSQSAPMSGSDC